MIVDTARHCEIVVIESPYGDEDPKVVHANEIYLDFCLRDALNAGHAPFASHGLYTRRFCLNDRNPAQRMTGIYAGFAFKRAASKTQFYTDLGMSPGMKLARNYCEQQRYTLEFCYLPKELFEEYLQTCEQLQLTPKQH